LVSSLMVEGSHGHALPAMLASAGTPAGTQVRQGGAQAPSNGHEPQLRQDMLS
jgi:hypothetical protein